MSKTRQNTATPIATPTGRRRLPATAASLLAAVIALSSCNLPQILSPTASTVFVNLTIPDEAARAALELGSPIVLVTSLAEQQDRGVLLCADIGGTPAWRRRSGDFFEIGGSEAIKFLSVATLEGCDLMTSYVAELWSVEEVDICQRSSSSDGNFPDLDGLTPQILLARNQRDIESNETRCEALIPDITRKLLFLGAEPSPSIEVEFQMETVPDE